MVVRLSESLQIPLRERNQLLGMAGRPPGYPDRRVICPRFAIDGATIRTTTVAARFESVADVTPDETRVELLHPEDDTADRFLRTPTPAA